ncbi:hypothetical protein METBIDRAFT_12950 [Metschnikowia bicuspidata var. bicuspidata NRRL YB-4993]|uniref:Uncharacterized protein n=1 Tax=Metschnikowia bicuspidata var. bicuspidata NRRL YB-4993 TaxID=869754 RepID=A0A1A0H741_9ASCO|nr:hypothetical protein METBIDRAFT_12950 [Metschnikowia bicuspidata var. bicuspidata NRRL YB-4993]OBA19919.1 hypothetical protein METBIDRAFT_12950 [Metschnikowia bicuspidata var. bicuspidata NRRL YB-4993]
MDFAASHAVTGGAHRSMLVVVGHTKWPENLGLLVSSQTTLIKDKPVTKYPKERYSSHPIDLQYLTQSNEESNVIRKRNAISTKTHRRPPSGLFDILYDENPTKSHSHTISSDFPPEKLKSPSYIEIERAILAGHTLRSDRNSPHAPTVTMIDEKLPRSGSIISNDASIRHRGTIKRRNKMTRREPSDHAAVLLSLVLSVHSQAEKVSSGRPKRSRLFSVFPVRRRTSYKYYPIQRREQVLRFTSQKEVDDYFLINNITSLMKELLPSTMANFEYKKLRRPNPLLVSHPVRFDMSPDACFTRLDIDPTARHESKHVTEHVRSCYKLGPNTLASEHGCRNSQSKSPEIARHRSFLSAVYTNYQRITFAGKRQIPLKLETVLPLENKMITDSERDSLNTQILMEVLLRRTVAAKIEFRLNQSRKMHNKPTKDFTNISGSLTSSVSNLGSRESQPIRYDGKYSHSSKSKDKKSKIRHNFETTSSESGDRVILSNSARFPSPQIS